MPNHWHALAAIWAMQAGKDVYVEKPVSHNVHEGRVMVDTARKYKRICQAGTQCRSMKGTIDAINWIHSGKIGKVTVARGHDGRTVILVPEAKHTEVTGMTLLHVGLNQRLTAPVARAVLSGYRHRYGALADAVTETEPAFDDALLAQVDLVDLLVAPVHVLAARWRGG